MLKFVLVLLLALAGCSDKELIGGLTQSDANQISLKLGEYGISTQISGNNRSVYTLVVSSGNLYQARKVLNELELPKEDSSNFDELIKPSGILPNSRKMEQLRLDHALAREFQDSLSLIAGIKKSNVLVRLNSIETGMSPSVSILIETSDPSEELKQKVLNLAVRTFPGVIKEQIEVLLENKAVYVLSEKSVGKVNADGEVLSYPLVPFFIWKVPSGVPNELGLAIITLTGFVFLLGIFFGWFIFKYKNLKTDKNSYD